MKEISILISLIFLCGCSSIFHPQGLTADNPLEQAIELEIRDRLGIDVDFTL